MITSLDRYAILATVQGRDCVSKVSDYLHTMGRLTGRKGCISFEGKEGNEGNEGEGMWGTLPASSGVRIFNSCVAMVAIVVL